MLTIFLSLIGLAVWFLILVLAIAIGVRKGMRWARYDAAHEQYPGIKPSPDPASVNKTTSD